MVMMAMMLMMMMMTMMMKMPKKRPQQGLNWRVDNYSLLQGFRLFVPRLGINHFFFNCVEWWEIFTFKYRLNIIISLSLCERFREFQARKAVPTTPNQISWHTCWNCLQTQVTLFSLNCTFPPQPQPYATQQSQHGEARFWNKYQFLEGGSASWAKYSWPKGKYWPFKWVWWISLPNFSPTKFSLPCISLPKFFTTELFSLPNFFTTENFHHRKFSPTNIFTT